MTMWDELFRPLEQIDFVPATNIVKKDDEFAVVLAVPGYTEDQLSLSIDDNVLEIRAQGAASTDNEVYLRREIRQLPFRYRVELPERAQVDQISAELKAGLLTVRIPLQGKKVIPVKIHSVDTTKSLQA
ncbi:Molecular chaperone IbpA, HSP20 family [Sulfobacillus thermosulfidooxidans DSM 9293]|uniref:Molecular chaperone IbpA, HSP20 family n=2 Tax=Sulfobacillus thermosulfidooxidans TaxID=28034 RepID=A0A1W1WCR3_SULTA|nr:Hsp20/alpha crystallin family protein [Sulfobacillus thermosulfidooxidans]PSR26561.1 MAG: Hsp20/alpha crystallin family protein [Sulfobacillus thermosulfidooxidans]SMC04101.1 Molecular chaperone IbpA, HSP20 family [Sulfobacillus thermosulfidooxidans DSM 9293]